MSLIKDLLQHNEDAKLLKLLERHCRATERIADCLEALLPSPLTDMKHRDLKPAGVETLKVYGEKEAYWDEVRRNRAEAAKLGEELENA